MCNVCKREICPSACPEYKGYSVERGVPVGQCNECGEYIYEDDRAYGYGRRMYCEECGSSLALNTEYSDDEVKKNDSSRADIDRTEKFNRKLS